LTGLSTSDALALLTALAGVVTAFIWHRRPRARTWWTIGAAGAAQLLLAGYCYAVIDGGIQGIRGRTDGSVSSLGWVDRAAGSSTVAWLDNLTSAAPPATLASPAGDQVRTALFWNSRLRSHLEVAGVGLAPVEWPLAALPGLSSSVDPRTGVLKPSPAALGIHEVVGSSDSAFLQLAGQQLARSPDGLLSLTRLIEPARATWLAAGLQSDGYFSAGAPVRLSVFAAKSTTVQQLAVTALLAPVPVPRVTIEVSIGLGGERRRVRLTAGSSPRAVRMLVCFPSGRTVATGALSANESVSVAGRSVAAILAGVSIAPVSARPGSCAH
jgi:hypothetical protein